MIINFFILSHAYFQLVDERVLFLAQQVLTLWVAKDPKGHPALCIYNVSVYQQKWGNPILSYFFLNISQQKKWAALISLGTRT